MPNVTEAPMTTSDNMTISEETAYAKFSAPSGYVEVISTINRGIQIRSKYKSEEMTIGINDHYLASVTYRSKTFPIFIALGILFGAVSFYFYLLALTEPYNNRVAMLTLDLYLQFFLLFLLAHTSVVKEPDCLLGLQMSKTMTYCLLVKQSRIPIQCSYLSKRY